mmetsp:Transcript_7213/g.16632  ORF Transcript_7213/g.16632 Transcript_7213/m.16632 type:complete len:113 (+) Transcript_7213:73-411(+)
MQPWRTRLAMCPPSQFLNVSLRFYVEPSFLPKGVKPPSEIVLRAAGGCTMQVMAVGTLGVEPAKNEDILARRFGVLLVMLVLYQTAQTGKSASCDMAGCLATRRHPLRFDRS